MRDFLSRASSILNDLKIETSNHSSRLSSSIGGGSGSTSNISEISDDIRQPSDGEYEAERSTRLASDR